MRASILYTLPKALEHLPLRVVEERLGAKILKYGRSVGPDSGRLTLPDFDEQILHERSDLTICGFRVAGNKRFVGLPVMFTGDAKRRTPRRGPRTPAGRSAPAACSAATPPPVLEAAVM